MSGERGTPYMNCQAIAQNENPISSYSSILELEHRINLRQLGAVTSGRVVASVSSRTKLNGL